MYDQDNSGAISPEEMVEIFTLMYSVQVGVASLQGKSTDTCFNNVPILMFQNQCSNKMFYIKYYLQGSSEEDAVEQARKVVSILADICWF